MVRRMSMYDKNGHRIKSSGGSQDDSEKLELPPISGEESQRGSASSNGKRKTPDVVDPNCKVGGKDVNGVLYRGFLSRRKMDGGSGIVNEGMVYLPQLRNPPLNGSVRTARSEPLHMGRRLIFEKNFGMNRSVHRGHNLKEFATDRVITIVERPNKRGIVDPRRKGQECYCVVSESRFRDIHDFVDELAKVLNAPERERYLHSVRFGNTVRSISELEDGGDYFFGPPNNDYRTSNNDLSTPDLIDSDVVDSEEAKRSAGASRISANRGSKQWPRKEPGRKRKIIVIPSYGDKSAGISFVVDEFRHKSISELCHDIGAHLGLTQQGYSAVERLCAQNGRTCMAISEIFLNAENTYIAVTTHDTYLNNSGSMWDDTYGRSFGYRGAPVPVPGPMPRAYPQFNGRDRTWRQPFDATINGKLRVFEPPSIDYHDPLRRKGDGPPLDSLEIDWVYGYNGKNCRNNLCLLPSLELVYFVAKVVVIFEPDEGKQRFYTEHTDEIRCITQHPDSWIIATGQASGGADKAFQHIRVWNAKTTETLNVLSYDILDMSVECLSFSQDDNGLKLAAIANSTDEWKLQVWDWEEAAVLSKSNPYTEIELACAFDPLDSNIIISCGRSHVYFWDIAENVAQFDPGRFYDYQVPDFVTCLGFNENSELITADSNGYLHKWLSDERKTYSILKTSHTSNIIALEVLQGDYVVTGGGSDRMLCLTNCDNEEDDPTIGEVKIAEHYGGIIAIAPVKNDFTGNDFENMKLVLGTSMNTILCGTPSDGEFECVVSGPADEIPALKAHPSENVFVVCGGDGYVTLCSGESRKELWDIKLDSICASVDFSPDGKQIAVGCSDGSWVELNTEDGYQRGSYPTEPAEVSCISYAPDGQYVTIGLETGAIYWFHCAEESQHYRYISSVKILEEAIISIDWSNTGTHMRFVTSQYDCEIWNVEKRCIEDNGMIIRDLQFITDSSAFGYNTAGIWNNPERDVAFPVTERHNKKPLFCAGANNGEIRLYNYPVDSNMVPYNEGNAHSSDVSAVAFLSGGDYLLSSGKNDYSIVQWKYSCKEGTIENIQDRRIRNSANYVSDERYRKAQRYGDYEPVPPPQQRTGYSNSGRRPAPFRRSSIFQQEYVAKHNEAQ